MRQAIEEGFILDVLENYTTFQAYWSLLKKIEADPRYDRRKATRLLRLFVDLHEHTIAKKVEVMVEHFAEHSSLHKHSEFFQHSYNTIEYILFKVARFGGWSY